MGIWVLPSESTVEVIKRVREALPDIERALPAGLKARIGYDASKYIDDALKEIVKTLTETLLIVAVVIFLFMGSFRSVLVPIVAMPLSLVGALAIMAAFGFTINLLTLLAIVLAVGIVVDDAIVVVENVERHVREGKTPFEAALLGARELVGPVISMTITLAAVYAPIAFQGGLTGALFREFAMTLAGAVAVSGFVALTLSPMMSAYLLKDHAHEEAGLTGWTNRLFDRVRNRYERVVGYLVAPRDERKAPWRLLAWSLVAWVPFVPLALAVVWAVFGAAGVKAAAGPVAGGLAAASVVGAVLVVAYDLLLGRRYRNVQYVLAGATLLTVLVVPFFLFAQSELAPKEDQGVVFTITLPGATSTIDHNVLYARQVQQMYAATPEYDTSFQLTAASFGFSGMILKPWSERKRTSVEIGNSLQPEAAKVAGLNVIVNTPDPLPAGGQFPIEFVIRSTAEHKEMMDFAQQLVLYANTEANAGGGMPTFFFADSDLKFDLPQIEIEIDRDKVASMGLSLASVARDLGSMLGGGYVNRFVNDGRSYRVIPQVERGSRLNPDQLLDYHVRGPGGQLIPLGTIARLRETVQPRTLNRFQQLNSVKITGVGPSINEALKKLEAKAAEILPAGYSIDYGGQSRQLRYEGRALWKAAVLALVLIFLVLAAQFNSFRDPFIIILGSVPLALVAAMLPIFLGETTLNIYSQIGLITLVGLVAKNGILIVEFANQRRDAGLGVDEAIIEAASVRLRPILMTSIATAAGALPLMLGSGPGSGSRQAIGIVVVFGVLCATALTLFIVPVMYRWLAPYTQSPEQRARDLSRQEATTPDAEGTMH
jgi:multidrug efflux pump